MRDKSIAALAFALFLLTTATLFLRPADWFVWMAQSQFGTLLMLSTSALALHAIGTRTARLKLAWIHEAEWEGMTR